MQAEQQQDLSRHTYNALNEDLKLRISLELYLKRLIVGGLERFTRSVVYSVMRVLIPVTMRFTLMELYQAYTDYEGMMELTESMYRYVAQKVLRHTDQYTKRHEYGSGQAI